MSGPVPEVQTSPGTGACNCPALFAGRERAEEHPSSAMLLTVLMSRSGPPEAKASSSEATDVA
jgi:hypothetical protein